MNSDFLYILSILTVLGAVLLIIIGGLYLFSLFSKAAKKRYEWFVKLIKPRLLLFSFLLVLISFVGSMYSSEVAGLEPCRLCWYQRMAMFPLVIIFLTALIRRDNKVFRYSLPLSMVGVLFAGYQYYLQLTFNPLSPCVVGGLVSCTEKYIFYFGFVTIPFMSLIAFLYLTVFGLISLKRKNKSS